MLYRQIVDETLAQYAYLIGCQQTGEALLVDPERDIDRYLDRAASEGVEIVAVAETHIHADFLSGAREFAERFDTTLYLSDEGTETWTYEWAQQPNTDGAAYDVRWLSDNDTFTIGNIEITALHTPGHTPEHLSFLVTDTGGGADAPMGLLTGDFVFVGDLGRPDLLESAAQIEGTMEPSARMLYASVQRVLDLPDHLQIWPGHGAGSACGKALGAVPQSTLGYEKQFNPMIDAARAGEASFVEAILADQPDPPLYFKRMKQLNKTGPPVLGRLPSPRELTVPELRTVAQDEEALVLDTQRDRSAFMARHLPGALYAPLDKNFSTVVGSLVTDASIPIYLLAEADEVETAVRNLVRVGYDNVVGYATPNTLQRYFAADGPTATIEEISFDTLDARRETDGATVLDVRYRSEFETGHIKGAQNAAYTRLPEYDDLPPDGPLLVHCGSGVRAAVASAFLQRTGRDVIYVNDHFSNYTASQASAEAA